MTGHQSRILIVDDDPALLKALPEMLELRAQGMSVETSDSAEAALDRIKAVDFDAIVTDIKMPGMDGVALLTHLRELRPETPALLITGHGEHDLAVQSLRAGAFDYIQKPIDRDYFIAALNRAIQVRALRRQVAQQQQALARHVAELEEAVQRRTRQLAETAERLGALTNLATAIHAATDIDAVLWSVADAARRLSDSEIAVAAAFPSRADARSNEIQPPQIAVAPRAGHGTIDMAWMTQWITSTWDHSRPGSGPHAQREGWAIATPAGPEAGICWAGAPVLTRGGEVLGAIVLGHSDRSWSPEVSRAQIEALARQAVVALENVRRYQREHAIAETLQRALLPASLPDLPGLKLDVVYRPGGQNSEIGGDWYDVFRLPDGALALSVGDVAGHGLDAAVIMGQVRQSIRSAALEGHSPFVVLERASTALRLTDETNGMATAVFGVLDPISLNFTYATAGHPAPVLLTADGEVQMLTSGGLPLGVEGPAIPRSWSITLPMHSLLVLYTDGLIESTRDIVEGEAALVGAVRAEFGSPSAHPAAAILERATVAATPADDIAILTISLDPVALEHFDLTLPATPSASSIARQSLRRLATSLGVPENNVFAWQVALGEAVNNAIEHAYGAGQGTVRLQAHVFDTQLILQVEDHGQWRSERAEGRGYGIRIMEAMVNRLEIRRSESGTTVRLTADLAGRRPEQAHVRHGLGALGERGRRTPGRVLLRAKRSSRTGGAVQAGARFEIRRVRGIPTVVVDGELDVSNARSFEAALVRAAKTDRHVVVVSLDKVTYLDSYAINVLLQFGERLTQNRQSLALVLPEQEAGRRILEITDMKGRYPVFPSLEQALDGSTQPR